MGNTERVELHDLITVDEAATQLGVSKRTVERMIQVGDIPVVRPTTRRVRIPQHAIDERLTAHFEVHS